jgi:hypothetical protein
MCAPNVISGRYPLVKICKTDQRINLVVAFAEVDYRTSSIIKLVWSYLSHDQSYWPNLCFDQVVIHDSTKVTIISEVLRHEAVVIPQYTQSCALGRLQGQGHSIFYDSTLWHICSKPSSSKSFPFEFLSKSSRTGVNYSNDLQEHKNKINFDVSREWRSSVRG